MSSSRQIFTVNGIIDTNKTVWQNVEAIANSCATWVTFDPFTMQYGVVINEPGTSVRSITEADIIGQIRLTETPWENLYNSCEVSFPNRDIRDRVDWIRYDEPVADRFDAEPDNKLTIQSDLINDPVQADVIAITELKQSRQNKTIAFTMDFTGIELDQGDVIDITIPYWDFNQKLFRITTIEEDDTDNGEVVVNITAIEYNSEVYNYDGIIRYDRSTSINIPAFSNNVVAKQTQAEDTGTAVGRALDTEVGKNAIAAGGVPIYDSFESSFTPAAVDSAYNAGATVSSVFQTTADLKNLQIVFESPAGEVDYDVYIDEVSESRTYAGNFPVIADLGYSTDDITYTLINRVYLGPGTPSHIFNLTDASAGYYEVSTYLSATLDLDQDVPGTVTGLDKSILNVTNVSTGAAPGGEGLKISWIVLL